MPESLEYCRVVGRFGVIVGDGSDADEQPDTLWVDEGEITFTPLLDLSKVMEAEPSPWTASKATVNAVFDHQGYVTRNGVRGVWLVDLTSEKLTPHVDGNRATYRVAFRNCRANDIPVELPTVNVRLGGPGDSDLTLLMPAPLPTGALQVPGPRGRPGQPLLTGEGPPTEDGTVDGEGYVDTLTGDLYSWHEDTEEWVIGGSVKGEPGALGARWAFLGDSITQGGADLWLDRIPSLMAAKSGGRIQIVRNAGVGGNTSGQMITRFDEDITPYAPGVVVLRAGTNDLTGLASPLDPGQVSERLEQYKTNIVALVAKVRQIGAAPVLMSVPPSSGSQDPQRQQFIFRQNAWLRGYCAQQGIIFIDDFVALADPLTGQYVPGYTDDGVHPNAAGVKASSTYVIDRLGDRLSPSVAVRPVGNADPFNLIPNGLLLDWASGRPIGYSQVSGTGTVEEHADPRFRGKVARIIPANESPSTLLRTTGYPVTPGDVLAVSARFLTTDISRVSIGFDLRNASGTVLKTVGATRLEALEDDTPSEFYTELVVPLNASTVRATLGASVEGGHALIGEIGVINLTQMDAVFTTPYTPPPEIPEQVTGLSSTTQTPTSISVVWSEAARAASYTVQYKPTSAEEYTSITGITETAYTVTDLPADTSFDIRVIAVNSTGPAAPSTVLTVATDVAPDPDAPIFADDFDRADGPLGSTPVGDLTWTIVGNGTPEGFVENGAAGLANGTPSQRSAAWVDAGAADGVYRATLATLGEGAGTLLFRYVNLNNQLFLGRSDPVDPLWALSQRVNGTPTRIADSTVPMTDGDHIEIILNGSLIEITINDTLAVTETVETHAAGASYGFGAVTNFDTRWDNISFHPL